MLRPCEENEFNKTVCQAERLGKRIEPRSEWNSITGTQGGPPPFQSKASLTDNQDRLMTGGHSGLERHQTPCAAHIRNLQGTSSTNENILQKNQKSCHRDNRPCYAITRYCQLY